MTRGSTRPRLVARAAKSGVHDWLVATAPDVPRADLPKSFLGGKIRLRWVRWAVHASLFLVPALALALVVTLSNQGPTGSTSVAVSSPTQAVAAAAVHRWMQETPSPVPGGQLLTWDGDTPLPQPSMQPGSTSLPADMVSHTFTVLASTGQLFKVSVVTATTAAQGTFAISEPALVPLAPAETGATAQSWQTLTPTTPTDGVRTAINAWTAAYTSGDPGSLLQVTGDPDTSHSYMPLTGVKFTSVDASQAAEVWGDTKPKAGADVPPAMVVRVDVNMYWLKRGETTVPGNLSASQVSPASFDVLVERTNTASPVVVAWGAAGSGELLTPHQNAIVGRSLVTETAEPSTPAIDSPNPVTPAGPSVGAGKNGGN
jgi:hypothetical protein